MLTFQFATEKDCLEAAALQRRRTLEEERKKRIFNPKTRLFGIDFEALDKQIDEKRKRDNEEKLLNEKYTAYVNRNSLIAQACERKEQEEKRKLLQEINAFREQYQKPEDRREFDLNDPNRFKKLLPARLHDDDPRLGPSSAQKFEGEDLNSDERARVQQLQFKTFLDQQIAEKEAADKERKMADDAYKAAMIARDRRAIELNNMEAECRKRLDQACFSFNKALAEEREVVKKHQKKVELEDNMAEMYNIMMSDMMTENPEVSQSNLGSNRQIGYLYKGMTKEQKQQIREIQMAQIAEAKQKREYENRFEREWADYNNGVQRTIMLMDKELKQKKREQEKKLAQENLELSIEQKNKIDFLNKVVYSNRPTAAYYDQFNKSSR